MLAREAKRLDRLSHRCYHLPPPASGHAARTGATTAAAAAAATAAVVNLPFRIILFVHARTSLADDVLVFLEAMRLSAHVHYRKLDAL
jgi:hypothetical protein